MTDPKRLPVVATLTSAYMGSRKDFDTFTQLMLNRLDHTAHGKHDALQRHGSNRQSLLDNNSSLLAAKAKSSEQRANQAGLPTQGGIPGPAPLPPSMGHRCPGCPVVGPPRARPGDQAPPQEEAKGAYAESELHEVFTPDQQPVQSRRALGPGEC